MKTNLLIKIALSAVLMMSCNFVTPRVEEVKQPAATATTDRAAGPTATEGVAHQTLEPTATEKPAGRDSSTEEAPKEEAPKEPEGWAIDQVVAMDGVNFHYKGLSCESERGPWTIEYDGQMNDGSYEGQVEVTYASDGIGRAAWEMDFRATSFDGGVFASGSGTSTLKPSRGGYEMTFGSTNWQSTGHAPGVSLTVYLIDTSLVTLRVEPAKVGRCP